jgi:hypothetical protein
MEFFPGRDTLPSHARSLRGESRRFRREREIVKALKSLGLHRTSPAETTPLS